jgi:DNA polymerase IIIc chi subunit
LAEAKRVILKHIEKVMRDGWGVELLGKDPRRRICTEDMFWASR